MTRRLIAGLLTLCMLVSLCPPNAFALRSSAAVVPETESTVVEPAAEEPKVEEPAAEEPAAEDPAAEEPAAEDPAAEDPQTEDPAAEDPKAEEETPKYATVNVNGSVKLTASAEDGGKWASDNIAAATVGAEKADAGEKNVAEVFGVAEGYTTVTYTKGDAVETWIVTVKAAPAEDTPAEEEPADVTYSVSRYLEEKAPEGSEVPFTYTQIDTISVTGKPGAEVTLPAVPDAIAVDTDADDIFPNEDGTAALTLPAETPEEHSLSVYYVKTESRPDINDLTIVEPSTKIDTYKFVVDGVTVSTQKVKAGETVYAPASPEKEGYKFTGWFSDGAEFVPGTKTSVSGITYTYTAQFEEIYYVYFLDNQDRVKVTKEYTKDQTIVTSDVSFPIGANKGIAGWTLNKEEQANVGDTLTVTQEDITLYPIVVDGYWITYNTEGGTIMEPDFFYENEIPGAPVNPEKPGYQFGGWTLKGEKYSFGSALSANITLDAVWTANTDTPYTIIYWIENADDDGHSFESQRVATGTTGTEIILSENDDGYGIGNINAEYRDGFTFEKYDKGKAIAGDGSTIVNVYYKRNEYTIYFFGTDGVAQILTCTREEHTHTWDCYNRWGQVICGKEPHIHSLRNGCYRESKDPLFTITAKYGARISEQWQKSADVNGGSTNWSTQKNGGQPWQAGIDVMPLGGGNFYVPTNAGRNSSSAQYYVEVLEGEDGTVEDDGRKYKLHHTDTIKSNNRLTVSKEDFYDITGFSKNEEEGMSTSIGSSYNGAKFYYIRNSYNLEFYNVNKTAKTESVKYETPLKSYFIDEATGEPAYTPERPEGVDSNYVFQGWYTSPACEAGTEAATKLTTMPAGNRVVYAKWAAPVKTAEVHVDIALVSDSKTLEVPYGQKINPDDLKDIKEPEGSTWDGSWVEWTGKAFVPFDINTTITRNVVLYPNFVSTEKYNVTYFDNNGTNPDPNTVTDTKAYNRGAIAGVQHSTASLKSGNKVFLGWALSADAKTPNYKPGDNFQVMGDTALYAIWGDPAATATLTYNPNGGDGEVKTEKDHLNNESVTLKSNTELGFTRTGYKFLGWSTNSTATEAEYLANAAIIVDNKSPNTLYAVWKKMDFQVTYSYTGTVPTGAPALPDGDTGTEGIQPFVHTYGTTVNVQTAPTLPGYTFSGWTTTDAEVTGGSFTMPDKNVAFTGTWTEKPDVTISYVATIGGSVSLASESVKPATGKATGSTATADDDYYFVSWTNSKGDVVGTNASFTPSKNSDGIYVADTYTAHFAPKTVVNVTITGANREGIYKGSAYTVNTADFTLGGDALPAGVTITLKETVPATVSRTDVGTTKMGLNADSFNINNVPYNYKAVITDVTDGYVNVTPKAVTVTADNAGKVFGEKDPDAFTAKVEGTLGNDTVTYTVSRAAGEAVGTYAITPSGAEAQGNYTVTYVPGTFTITASNSLTLTATGYEGDYDANSHAGTVTPSVTEGTTLYYKVGTDDWTTTAPTITNVGEVSVTVEARNANYVTKSATYTLKVTPKAVTVTADNAGKVFGEKDPDAFTAKVEGTLGNDTVTYTVSRAAGEAVGTYAITPSGAEAQGNYTVTYVPGTFTITAQSITPGTDPENPNPDYLGVTVGDLGDLVYNGLSQEQEPVVKDKNKVDLVKGTDYTLSYSTDTTNVGTVTVTVTGIGNYTGTVTRTYEITPAPYTVTTYSAIKVYDGHPLTAGGEVDGLVNGETCTVNTTASRTEYGTTENKPYTLTWDTANKNNYEFKGETIGTLTVVRQSINPTDPPIPTDPDGEKPIDPDQSYYGGVEVKAPENVKYNGQLQEQKPAVTDKDGTPLAEGTDYTLSWTSATDVGTVTVTVTGKGNYQGEVKVTYQITPRHVTLTSEGGTKPYDGTPLTKPGVAVGGDGFVAGEVTAITATGTVTNVTEGKVKNAITYTEGTGFKAGNYEITKVEGELYVTKAKEGIVTVTGKSATYVWTGDEREVTGFTHDGAARLITVELKKGAEAAARGTAVGTYAMGLKAENFTASSPNYETVKVVVVDGELVIETINITVTVTVRGNKETVTFDGDPHTVTGYKVISAIANTGMDMGMDGFTLTLKGTASATGTEVGTYNMGLTAGDFTITSDIYRVVRVVVEDGGLEITPAPEEITEPTEEIPDETVPLAPPEEDNIPDEPVPQAGPAWALINLILSILTVLASLLLLVGYFGKKEEEAEDENGNAILDAEGNNVMNDIKKRGGWRLASLVPAILSVIAFLLTENMRNPMILVDRWTLLMVIIAVVQVLVMLLSKKKTEDNTQEA